MQLANPQLIRMFVDDASADAPFRRLVVLAVAFIAVAVGTQLATVAETYVAEDLGWRTTNALRIDLTAHVLALDDTYHADHGTGELIERIDGDVAALAGFFGRFVVNVIGSGVFLVGVLVLLWREDWRVGGVVTLSAVAALGFMLRGGGFVRRRTRRARQVEAELSAFLEERLSALPDLKANGGDDDTMRRFHQHLASRFLHGRHAVLGASMFSNVVNAIFVLGTAGALTVSAVLQRSGGLTVGSVFLVFRYAAMLRMPLERLSRHMNSFQQAMGAIARVQEVLATRPRVVDGRGAVIPPGPLAVEFDRVGFSYGDEPVLRDVSFRLEPGEVLGLLGRTGAGKTTMSRLLFRLHDVGAGAVRLGGTDVRDARLDHLRSRVGLVTQDVHLFGGTLRDNVTLFNATVADEQLLDVFAALDLDQWLRDLPEGLDTVLGSTGRGLSGGEAQLVAFARVFLEDPGLVVLDEASSRLDPHTERLLERAMSRLLANRTAIVIAHRLPTVRRADSILVLDAGRVAEFGDRSALEAEPASHYARLLRAGLAEVGR